MPGLIRYNSEGSYSAFMSKLHVRGHVTIPAEDLSWSASRASGPGGQNVNKVATKVTLRFDLRGTDALSRSQKARLRGLAKNRLDSEGRVVIAAQSERTQRQNLRVARERLRRLVERSLTPPKKRKPTKPSKAAKRRRLDSKRHQSDKKRSRRRVRADD